jgi:hypothetical protein
MHNDLAGDNNSDVEVKFFFWCHYISYSYNIIIKFQAFGTAKSRWNIQKTRLFIHFLLDFLKCPNILVQK